MTTLSCGKTHSLLVRNDEWIPTKYGNGAPNTPVISVELFTVIIMLVRVIVVMTIVVKIINSYFNR
jgi:hypothetical protein